MSTSNNMSTSIKRALIIGGVAVAALGAGGVAWAATSDSSAGSPTVAATGAAHHALGRAELRADHATWVTGKSAKFVTHQEIRGTITAVDATSITLKAADGYSETFKVDAHTKVQIRDQKKTGASASVGQLKIGEKAGVLGTGATGPTADRILAGTGTKKASGTGSHTSTGSTTTSG